MELTRRQRFEGEIIPPFYYGYAYADFSIDSDYYYPIPLNFIIRGCIRLKYYWDRFRSKPSYVDREIMKGIHRHLLEFDSTVERKLKAHRRA
jgi:hypothetical protein